ncbi:MAG TPA: hypothetical protein VKQ36_05365 [Ktedonobacterales bacterium]|nr:hypothetical protein [Ktedonobacterales bacterium]
MAEADITPKKARGGIGTFLLNQVNPIRDPSLLIAAILTAIEEGAAGAPIQNYLIYGVLNWIAVKAIIWMLVNFAFSSVYLVRKAGWVIRHPRLAWRLLDALGVEEIIIGGLRPDMFATEDGGLHEGELGFAAMGAPAYYGAAGAIGGPQRGYPATADDLYDSYGENGYRDFDGTYGANGANARLSEEAEELREAIAGYTKLLSDWMGFTEEKWRAVSDSQLGWKPLRGRWNGWDEIYRDSFAISDEAAQLASDQTARRFENSSSKGSAASAVACFMRDLDSLRESLAQLEGGEPVAAPRMGGMSAAQPQQAPQRTNKRPIIRNPMIVDADR